MKKKKSMYDRVYLVLLVMMSAMGLLGSDMYITAMPLLREALGTTTQNIQLTLSTYLFGLAFFQLIAGPMSDYYGRRKVLLVGFLLFSLSSLACSWAGTLTELLIYRFFQAIGACTGLVVGRATINDRYSQDDAARVYTIVYPIVAASPALAPIIGSYLTQWYGWESTFFAIFVYGALLYTLSLCFLEESLPPADRVQNTTIFCVFKDMGTIVCHRHFLSFLIPVCSIYGAWFVYIAQSSFIYSELGYTKVQMGKFYFPMILAMYTGNFITRKLISRISADGIFIVGLSFFSCGALCLLAFYSFGLLNSAIGIIIPLCIMSVSNGILLPIGISSAINIFSERSGSASAITGFFQMGMAALSSSAFSYIFGVSVKSLTFSIVILASAAVLGYVTLSPVKKDYRLFGR